ncbi:unnamed protein product [Rotaria sp. Silwood1]|nr:unnamed protein product [Rotaria sp. Silwood1]
MSLLKCCTIRRKRVVKNLYNEEDIDNDVDTQRENEEEVGKYGDHHANDENENDGTKLIYFACEIPNQHIIDILRSIRSTPKSLKYCYDEAVVKYRKAKKIYDNSLPPDHPNHAVPRVNLGNVYLAAKDYSKACEEYEIALKLQQQSLPSDHPNIARTLHNLAIVQTHLGNIEQAKQYLERAEEIANHVLSSKHPVVSSIRKTKALMAEES